MIIYLNFCINTNIPQVTPLHKGIALKALKLSWQWDHFSLFLVFHKIYFHYVKPVSLNRSKRLRPPSLYHSTHTSDGTFHVSSDSTHPTIASESKINTTKPYTKQNFLLKSPYLFLGGTKKRDYFSGVSMETRTTLCKGIPEVGVAQAVLLACWIKQSFLGMMIYAKIDSFVLTFIWLCIEWVSSIKKGQTV